MRLAIQNLSQKVDQTFSLFLLSAFPKSVSIADLLQARKLNEPPKTEQLTLSLQYYHVEKKTWEALQSVKFTKEVNSFAEGGSRKAFMATRINENCSSKWVIKHVKEGVSEQLTNTLNLTVEAHTRKQVQMHSAARRIAQAFAHKVPAEFGELFHYKKIDFSKIEETDTPVTVEQFIPGNFCKYINNNGQIAESTEEQQDLLQKAEYFVRFSFVYSNNQLMVLDLQGVGYQLFDPEI